MFLSALIFGIVPCYLYFITGNALGFVSLHSIPNATQLPRTMRTDVPTDAPFIMYALAGFANAIILFIILALLIVVHRHEPSWLKKCEAT